MSGLLVLVRHGQSTWNARNVFTGWRDPDLSPLGEREACAAGRALRERGLVFCAAFTSTLVRAQHTCALILAQLGQQLPVTATSALNERDYGALAGMDKNAARARWGADQVRAWRRSYDAAPPGGESLKDTAARVLPFFCEHILPQVLAGGTVLVSAHGNSLRALVMALDRLSPDAVAGLEIPTGAPLFYRLDDTGELICEDAPEKKKTPGPRGGLAVSKAPRFQKQ